MLETWSKTWPYQLQWERKGKQNPLSSSWRSNGMEGPTWLRVGDLQNQQPSVLGYTILGFANMHILLSHTKQGLSYSLTMDGLFRKSGNLQYCVCGGISSTCNPCAVAETIRALPHYKVGKQKSGHGHFSRKSLLGLHLRTVVRIDTCVLHLYVDIVELIWPMWNRLGGVIH